MKVIQRIGRNAVAYAAICAGSLLTNIAFALDANTIKTTVNNGVAVLQSSQSSNDGGWGDVENLGYVNTAAAVEALRTANQRTSAYYSGVAWLENHNANNVDLKARKVLDLVKHGNNINPDISLLQLAKQDTTQRGWGLSSGYFSSPLDTALVLQAFSEVKNVTDRDAIVAYLVATQMGDGGWSIVGASTSNYLVTAEVILALVNNQVQPGVANALSRASSYLSLLPTASVNSVILSRVALALYKLNGVNGVVDNQVTVLLSKQIAAGNWGDVLSTSNAITTLAYCAGLNTLSDSSRVVIDQEQLRTIINKQLGYSAYGQLTQADIRSLTSLDLRTSTVSNLNGLQGATNLQTIKVNASTSLSAITGLGASVLIDTDVDDIADSIDNCPAISNKDQANMDGDAWGDVCDTDIDGDKMPNTWEVLYGFDPKNASDGNADADGDGLSNAAEYLAGTNPRVSDTDGDGLSDGVEVLYGLNPLNSLDAAMDFDHDGLTNAREIALHTDLNNWDTDHDNMSDGDEILVGRNPLLNEPALIVIISGLLLR